MLGWWYHLPKAFSEAECAAIISYGLSLPVQTGTVGGATGQIVDPMRKSTVRWLPRDNAAFYWLYSRMESLCLTANAETFGFDLFPQSGGFKDIQFTEYHGGEEGKYDWHEDNGWKGHARGDRKLSMSIILSKPEDYEGGRLEVHRDALPATHMVNQGDTLIFPSFNVHRVTPVTKGVRYSLVTWFLGPRFR